MSSQTRRFIFIYFLMAWYSICALGQTPCYQLVWADEFSGTSLDLTKWTQIVGEGGAVSGNAELQYYTARSENTQVSGGTLKIIALQETYGGNAYTSARMQTKNMGDWLYGKMEARIKLPVGKGMWPAFWMLPTDNIYGIWPRSGEIDIMELIGRLPSDTHATIHYGDDGVDHGFGTHLSLSSGTFADDFHVFSMEWSPNEIKIFLDGTLYFTATPSNITSPHVWRFDKRFYILLNLAIGGPWALSPDATTTFPQTMEVDYVRVYQKIADMEVKGVILTEPNANSVTYSVPSLSGVTYQWSVSGAGNTIASGQNTHQITVHWGNTSGMVSVLVQDGCSADATLNLNVTVSPNLWSNYGFEQNYVSWETRPAYSSNLSFGIATTGAAEGSKAACINVLSNVTPSEPWNMQLSRTNLDLTAGTSYTLRFKAKSDAARPISASFITSLTYNTIGSSYRSMNLTTDWQPYSITFTPSSSVTGAMFNVDLAREIGTYCFDDFVFGRTTLLPVELVSFRGQTVDSKNQLFWKTASEINTQSFEIQRLSSNKSFQTIGQIYAKNRPSDYEFVDETPLSGIHYYRLKIKDFDGKIAFSPVISLVNQTDNVTLYPNPVKHGNFNVHLMLQEMQTVNILIYNSLGQKIWFYTTAPQVGNIEIPIQLPQMTKGLYRVEIRANSQILTQKIER
jgi:beta-glucanase (GH16 family)